MSTSRLAPHLVPANGNAGSHLVPSRTGEQDESLCPAELTWQLCIRDVHGVWAESNEDLLAALEAAGWPEEKLIQFRGVDLSEVILPGTREDDEYTQETLEFAGEDDVYTSSLEWEPINLDLV